MVPRTEGILGRTGIITIDLGEILGHSRSTTTQVVGIVFREPVHQILEKIKNKPYSQWPNRMGETPRSTTNVFIANTTRNEGTLSRIAGLCEQLVKVGKLKQCLH